MATTFYAKQAKATTAAFIADMARFMINDLGGFTGPGWTIVDTYSSAAGTPHEVPSDTSDMDSLAADNGWRTNTLVAGDYIILQNNNGSYPFQVGIEYESTILIRFILAPKSGFLPSVDHADMTDSSNWGEAKLATFDYTTINSSSNYSIVADENHFKLIFEQWATVKFTYMGLPNLDSIHTGDAYPALYYYDEGQVNMGSSYLLGAKYIRLSPVDEATTLTLTGNSAVNRNYGLDAASSEYELFPIRVTCTSTGHYGDAGELIGTYACPDSMGVNSKGTLNSQAYAFVSNSGSSGAVAFDWDGATAF
jgi:hypothetical protein